MSKRIIHWFAWIGVMAMGVGLVVVLDWLINNWHTTFSIPDIIGAVFTVVVVFGGATLLTLASVEGEK